MKRGSFTIKQRHSETKLAEIQNEFANSYRIIKELYTNYINSATKRSQLTITWGQWYSNNPKYGGI